MTGLSERMQVDLTRQLLVNLFTSTYRDMLVVYNDPASSASDVKLKGGSRFYWCYTIGALPSRE